MARTIEEIKKEMTDEFMSDKTLQAKYGFTSEDRFSDWFSKVSIENILFYLHAVRIWVLETMFEAHLAEVSEMAEKKRSHTLAWYREKALEYQHGCSLSEESAVYDNQLRTEEELQKMRIVKKCSTQTTMAARPTIQIKVAKEDSPLNEAELESFRNYMTQVADAGLQVVCISGNPDPIRLWLTVLYDPLVLDSKGNRYIGGANPVKETIQTHLQNLVWNGVFYPRILEQELMRQDGIRVAHVTQSKAGAKREEMITIGESYEPYYGAIQCDMDNDLFVTSEPF